MDTLGYEKKGNAVSGNIKLLGVALKMESMFEGKEMLNEARKDAMWPSTPEHFILY